MRGIPTTGIWGHAPPGKFYNLGHSEMVSGAIYIAKSLASCRVLKLYILYINYIITSVDFGSLRCWWQLSHDSSAMTGQ